MNARYRDKCLSVKERQAAAYAAKRVIEKQLDDVARRAQYARRSKRENRDIPVDASV